LRSQRAERLANPVRLDPQDLANALECKQAEASSGAEPAPRFDELEPAARVASVEVLQIRLNRVLEDGDHQPDFRCLAGAFLAPVVESDRTRGSASGTREFLECIRVDR
jgi:hypothetical protein